jgi:transcriptional antiterminator RfaH
MTWHLGLTKPERGSEERARVHLLRQRYEVYLPKHRVASGELRPLFRRYIFVAFDPATTQWRAIQSTRGMCGLVSFDDYSPAKVAEEVVHALKAAEASKVWDERLPAQAGLLRGQQVRLLDGPLAGVIGSFVGMQSAERVKVLLHLLGGDVTTTIHRCKVEAVIHGRA